MDKKPVNKDSSIKKEKDKEKPILPKKIKKPKNQFYFF